MHAETLREVGRGNCRLQDIQLCSRCSLTLLGTTGPASDARLASLGRRSAIRGAGPQAASMPVVTGAGSHPFPFRTRKLSLLPPMVLHGKLCGRVGRCRQSFRARCEFHIGPSSFVPGTLTPPHSFPCERSEL